MVLISVAAGVACVSLLTVVARRLAVEVREGESIESIVTMQRARVVSSLATPGWHVVPPRLGPGTTRRRDSLRHDSRTLAGTWIHPDRAPRVFQVWLDFKVTQPRRMLSVASDFDAELNRVVHNAATTALNAADAAALPKSDTLNRIATSIIAPHAATLGIEVHSLMLQISAPAGAPLRLAPREPAPRARQLAWKS